MFQLIDRLRDSTDAKNNENTTGIVKERGKLHAVEKYVSDNIFQWDEKAVSMDVLQNAYSQRRRFYIFEKSTISSGTG